MEIMKQSANFSKNYIKNFFGSRVFDQMREEGGDEEESISPTEVKMLTRTVSN
jgi:hypothetical protein